jgi:hypothetical protein
MPVLVAQQLIINSLPTPATKLHQTGCYFPAMVGTPPGYASGLLWSQLSDAHGLVRVTDREPSSDARRLVHHASACQGEPTSDARGCIQPPGSILIAAHFYPGVSVPIPVGAAGRSVAGGVAHVAFEAPHSCDSKEQKQQQP